MVRPAAEDELDLDLKERKIDQLWGRAGAHGAKTDHLRLGGEPFIGTLTLSCSSAFPQHRQCLVHGRSLIKS